MDQPFIWLWFSSQGKGIARTGPSEASKRGKVKKEFASPSAVLQTDGLSLSGLADHGELIWKPGWHGKALPCQDS